MPLKGHKQPEEAKEKIRAYRTGKPAMNKSAESRKKMSEAKKGKVSWNKGIKTSLEIKKKLSEAKKGDKCYAWKGGVIQFTRLVRAMFEYRLWRDDVFTRDDHSCQMCASKENLHAHHIKFFSVILEEYKIKTLEDARMCSELWNRNNGITLCKNCHFEHHKSLRV